MLEVLVKLAKERAMGGDTPHRNTHHNHLLLPVCQDLLDRQSYIVYSPRHTSKIEIHAKKAHHQYNDIDMETKEEN